MIINDNKAEGIVPKKITNPPREVMRLRIPKSTEGEMERKSYSCIDIFLQVIENRLKNSNHKQWIDITRDLKVKLLGKQYVKIFRQLQELGLIKVFKANNDAEYYRKGGWIRGVNGQYVKSDSAERYGQCKMYRLSDELYKDVKRGEVTTLEFTVSVKKLQRRISLLKDMTDMDDPAAAKLKRNIEKLDTIDLKGLSYKSMVNAEKHNQGIVDGRRTESGRLFGIQVTGGSKEVCKRYHYRGAKLNELDMKSAHPNLIPALLPEDEQRKWLKWSGELSQAGTDIYMFFVEGKKTEKKRKRMKVIFEQAISGKGKGKDVRRILDYFAKEFVSLYCIITASGIDGNEKTQMRLQKIESSIIIPAFLAADFMCIPRHDCLMVRDCDREKARELINRISMEVIRFTVPFGNDANHPPRIKRLSRAIYDAKNSTSHH